MKSNHRNTPAALKPRSKHSQALFERAELVIFELPRRDTKIKKRAPYRANCQLIEKAECAPEIRLSHREAITEACQLLTDVLDRVGIPVQRQNVGPTPQKRFRVATATTCGIYDK